MLIFERPFSVIIADIIPSGPERLVLIVLTRPSLSASSMVSQTSWSDSPVPFWMVLGRAKLRPTWSGLMPVRNLRTRIISERALERPLKRLAHDLGGETRVNVCILQGYGTLMGW